MLRGPAATAKILAAIDLLSGGRLLVGLGPRLSARDYELVGVSFEERWKCLEEAVQALARTGKPIASPSRDVLLHRGLHARAAAHSATRPTDLDRKLGIAGRAEARARLADGWLASGYNMTPELFAQAWSDIQAELVARGRDVRDSERHRNDVVLRHRGQGTCRRDARGRARALARSPGGAAARVLPIGPAEECAMKLLAYEQAGAQRIFLWPLADEQAQLELFRERDVELIDASLVGFAHGRRAHPAHGTFTLVHPEGSEGERDFLDAAGRLGSIPGVEMFELLSEVSPKTATGSGSR